MAQYWLDLFTPETWEEAEKNNFKLSGFRENRWHLTQQIKPGDFLVCYLTGEMRFSGILKVISKPYFSLEASKKVWRGGPFPCVMDIEPVITLDLLHSIPADKIVPKLTIAKKWGGIRRGSLNRLNKEDGDTIKSILEKFLGEKREYPLKRAKKIKVVTNLKNALRVRQNKDIEEKSKNFLVNVSLEHNTEWHQLKALDKIKIREIIKNVDKLDWVIPNFQRYFDWNKKQVSELLESIIYDLHVGSFLLWDIDRGRESGIGVMPIQGVSGKANYSSEIILDGQQRITSLYYAIKSPDFALEGTPSRLFFYFDLKALWNNEENVVFFEKEKIDEIIGIKSWFFPIFEIENFPNWINNFEVVHEKEYSREDLNKIRYWMQDCLRHFWEGYEIPYIPLPSSMTLDQVVVVFEKINTKGKRLDVFDLLIARFYSEGIDLRTLWEKAIDEFPLIKKFDSAGIPVGVYIFNTLMLLWDKNSSVKKKDVLNIIERVYKADKSKFEADWNEVVGCIEETLQKMEGLRDGFGIVSPETIPYNPTIPVIAALLYVIKGSSNQVDANNKLYKWYWATVFSGAYEASGNSRISMDYKEMVAWLTDSKMLPTALREIERKINSLDLEKTTSSFGAIYKGILSLIALAGGLDLAKHLKIENYEDLDRDHVFPRAYFKDEKHIDSILNITWMSSETNQKIKKAKKPSIFFSSIFEEKYHSDEKAFLRVLESHLINKTAYKALLENDFDSFIRHRKEEIIKKIRQLIGSRTVLEKEIEENPNEALNIFENKMRNFIDRIISQKYGSNYWKQRIPGDVKENVEERIGSEINKNPAMQSSLSSRDKLDYLDIREYFLILRYNWDLFSDIFRNRDLVLMHMNHICDYRNPEKHARNKSGVVKKLGEAGLEWVIGCIDKKY